MDSVHSLKHSLCNINFNIIRPLVPRFLHCTVYTKVSVSPRTCIMFCHILCCGSKLFASCLTPILEYCPLAAICDCLFDLHKYSSFLKTVFSICSLRTCHVLMTRDPLNRNTACFYMQRSQFSAYSFCKMGKLNYVQL
jgi:hypothetical protein